MKIGFELNPYDPCVANKTINGKQLTLVWHVDYIKASHVEEEVVTSMAKWLRKTYERIFKDGSVKMKLCRVKVHDYLGMNLDYTIKGEVKITMIPYIKEMIKDFREYDPSPDKIPIVFVGAPCTSGKEGNCGMYVGSGSLCREECFGNEGVKNLCS